MAKGNVWLASRRAPQVIYDHLIRAGEQRGRFRTVKLGVSAGVIESATVAQQSRRTEPSLGLAALAGRLGPNFRLGGA